MSRIIERALSIINDNLKDQTSSFADPISIKPMARGGRLLEDEYPTHYLPHVGRQVMADGGAPIKGFEGRVSSSLPVEEPVTDEGISAYHGSPHEFENFDTSKIGTGEGAQAYGHGLYFAENEGVAKSYRDDLSAKISVDGKPILDKNKQVGSTGDDYIDDILMAHHGDLDKAIEGEKIHIKSLQDLNFPIDHVEDTIKKLEELKGRVNASKPGHMYEVRLNVGPEHLLDWDKPLSEQHPEVKESLRKAYESIGMKDVEPFLSSSDNPGSDAYESLGRNWGGKNIGSHNAANLLKNSGIRGIRYLDAGSRGKDGQSGSHNIVIFDPKHIKTVRRYAEGGEVPEKSDKGIVAYAFGNSVPHLDKRYEEEALGKSELAQGVEPVSEDTGESQSSIYAKENDLLQPIGKSKMAGDEKLFFDDGLYKAGASTHAWNNKKSIRYLHHDEDGNPIGALQIMTHGPRTKKATIQNVYVAEDHRRKKIASGLLKRARQDFDVRHSTDLTDQGRAFSKAAKAYGGSIIPGPKLTEENADDFARRLIAWTFATAPLFHKASGGSVIDDPLDVISKLRR